MAPGEKKTTTSMLSADQEIVDMPGEFAGLSLEEIQRRIALADLKAKMLDLDRIQDENQQRLAKKEALKRYNAQIQADIKSQKQLLEYAQRVCRHKQGGRHQNVWAGDGKPCVVRAQMLDGFTYLLQCTRCRKKIFTPHPSMQKSDPERYAKEKIEYDKFWEMSSDSGLDEIRGPTFTFIRDGAPFIPERT